VTRRCPGCGHGVRSAWYACMTCWRRLPADLRTRLLRAWGRRQHGVDGARTEHEAAKSLASVWFSEHPR
jgi:hypothetical protein